MILPWFFYSCFRLQQITEFFSSERKHRLPNEAVIYSNNNKVL